MANAQELITSAKNKMQDALDYLLEEFRQIRTGRASTAMVDEVKVEVYGQETPLKAIAQISTPDAKSITISPWDQTNLSSIEKAIREDQNLGFNPMNDGKNIHINVPPLTEERRTQIAKQLNEKVEQCFVSQRNARHEAMDGAKKAKNNGDISEDDARRVEKELTQAIEDFRGRVNKETEDKKAEIMQV